MNREHRRVLNQRIATQDDAVQLLRDTRRTLLKLVANIDEALTRLENVREEERVTTHR